jgi:hypothetical protein
VKIYFLLIFTVLFTVFNQEEVYAWKIETHKLLSRRAAENSVLSTNKGNYLNTLGFNNGVEEEFRWNSEKKTVTKWIETGADLEDAGTLAQQASGRARFANHFHNPLKFWAEAGLDDSVLGIPQAGMSSLLWAQDTLKQTTFREGDWSWQTIREHYYRALTAATADERQAYFARTFRGLGHQMHLLQDAAQPDHVRNDAHAEDALFERNRFGLYFESWAEKNPNKINSLAASPIFPAVDLSASHDSRAPVPISQFLDTDQYHGTNPTVSLSQGIAEYTNANFFSDDTIFAAEDLPVGDKHYFPYPKKSSTNLLDYLDQNLLPKLTVAEDVAEDIGFWIAKTRDGEIIDHFVKPGYLARAIYDVSGVTRLFQRHFYCDEKCHEEYAQKLIPRAVGYSAALVDYFFRGVLTLEQAETDSDYVLVNQTAEAMDGAFELYYDSTADERRLLWQSTLALGANGSGTHRSNPLDFPMQDDAQNPGEYVLVFSGRLGAESEAVVGAAVRLVTTVTGTLVDGAGGVLTNRSVVAVVGEAPNRYERTVASDANGVFVFEDFPAYRGEIHLEVWEECITCRIPREGPGTMIPQNQLLLFAVDIADYDDMAQFNNEHRPPYPIMFYRAKTNKRAPVLNGTVDFGLVSVEYVSVVYEQLKVPGTRGADLPVWGSFPGEIYLGNSGVYGFFAEEMYGHTYPDSVAVRTGCPSGGITTRQWSYRDGLRVDWVDLPTLSQGRVIPTFDDAEGQVVGVVAMTFNYRVSGGYRAPTDENGSGCLCQEPPESSCPDAVFCTGDVCGASITGQVQKDDLKAFIKVYR